MKSRTGYQWLFLALGLSGAAARAGGADLPTAADPVHVVFVRAYRGLYAENEALTRADPLNADKFFTAAVDSATGRLDAAFFDVDDPGAVAAFERARARGVGVRLVTDSDNMRHKEHPEQPRPAIAALEAAGVGVRGDGREPFMHHKFMVVDDDLTWVGSMNLTTDAMYRDNNNAILVRSAELAGDFRAEFHRLFDEGLFGPNPHEMPHPFVRVGDATMRVLFSPEGGTLDAMLEAAGGARERIHFMVFSFTERKLEAALVRKLREGLEVEGVFDSCLVDEWSAFNALRAAGVPVREDGNQALLHHKVAVLDGRTVITGSFNFSENAERHNNESSLFIESPAIAAAFEQEYARVREASLTYTNLPPYDHPACRHGQPRR